MEVRDVVVTGGTGRLGRRMVDQLDAERVVERSLVPWTILRSTQFHEFAQVPSEAVLAR